MKKVLRYSAWGLAAVLVLVLGAYSWAYQVSTRRYETQWTVHTADFPIPFPLAEDELSALRAERIATGVSAADPLAGVDLQAAALEFAIRRGRHIAESRAGCSGCHGKDLGGGTIIDIAVVARWVAPNLTSGAGSVTNGFSANDWDRAVRHAVRHNGRTSSMPSQEFLSLTDHELSDIVAYIRSLPAVDRDTGTVKLGPIFAFLIATDPGVLAAFTIDHDKPHITEPPVAAPTVELGQHIIQVCRGCHGPGLSGGRLLGDPNMPIVANLTPHETGLKSWSEDDFIRALREGIRKDGTTISPMMPWKAYAQMTDTEIRAMWVYLQSLPAVAKGNH